MALFVYNKTGVAVALAGITPTVSVPASAAPPARGAAVNVTSELKGLAGGVYAGLDAQRIAGTFDFEWVGPVEYATAGLTCTSVVESSTLASTSAGQGASLIGVQDSAGIIAGTTVESALAELAAMRWQKKSSITITFAELNALGAVKTGSFALGTALPANARQGWCVVVVGTKFQNAGDTDTTTCDVGTSVGTHSDVAAKTVTLKTAGTYVKGSASASGGFGFPLGTEQAVVTVNSDVNFDTLTAGSMTVDLWYFVQA